MTEDDYRSDLIVSDWGVLPPHTHRRAPLLLDDNTWVDAIVGYRCWGMVPVSGRVYLTSVATVGSTWPVEGGPAVCTAGRRVARELNLSELLAHAVPLEKCTCGWWAYNEPSRLLTNYKAISYLRGEVYMWGKIISHDHGYRSEFAKVAAVYDPASIYPDEETLTPYLRLKAEVVAATYDVPLVQAPPLKEVTP